MSEPKPTPDLAWAIVVIAVVGGLLLWLVAPDLNASERIDLCVAVGTGLLAVATVWLGLASRKDSEKNLLAASRPVVVAEHLVGRSTDTKVLLRLTNVGPGAALNVRLTVYLFASAEPTAEPETRIYVRDTFVLGPNAEAEVTVVADPVPDVGAKAWGTWPRVKTLIEYQDVAENLYSTTADLGDGGLGTTARHGPPTII